jgi:glycosyltransferase involved in cell wall biosynthesis
VQRFISKAFEEKLTEILRKEDFDIVQMETLFMAPYLKVIRKQSRAKAVLRAHNIEHLIWKRMTQASRNPLKKCYLNHLYKTLEQYEKSVLNQFDGILPITEKDAAFFRQHTQKPVKTIPFGINPDNFPETANLPVENALFHIGAMNWMPNEEGIRWFLKKAWPLLVRRFPEIKLYLAGRAMPPWLLRLHEKNIVVAGEVESAQEFIASKSISIAPLFSGSGVRIKILESMSLGKAVVSTSTGAEGIEYSNGKDILIADTAETFAEAVARLYQNPEEARRIGKNARRLIETKHNNPKIIKRLETFYEEIL